MSLVIKSNDDSDKSPHLALCHEAQGFSANNRHVSLLMKSGIEITEEITKALEVLGVSEINKAAFYSQVRLQLQEAVKKKYADDDYGWLYVEDFNDSVVIFCNEKGLWSTSYSLDGSEVSLGDLATPVTSVLTYVSSTGNMLLSEDAEDKLEEGVYSLVAKALENTTTKEHLIEMFKSKENEVLALQEEIKKAVDAAEAILKSQLQEKDEQLTKALEEVAEFKKAQKEAKDKTRKEKLEAVMPKEEAEELYKSLSDVADEAFEAVFKTLEKKAQVEKESDLFMEKGVSGEGDAPKQEEAGLALVGELINKAKSKKQ